MALYCNNTNVTAENCLISNSGKNVYVEKGGTYSFVNCTVAAYSNNFIAHKNPAVFLSDADATNQTSPLTATLRNCIIYGDPGFVDNDIQTSKTGSNSFVVNLDRCLYRAAVDPANTIISQSIKNIDPSFDSINANNKFYNFRITKNLNAPGLNKGIATSLVKDLDDNNRNVGLPDIGAYEKQ